MSAQIYYTRSSETDLRILARLTDRNIRWEPIEVKEKNLIVNKLKLVRYQKQNIKIQNDNEESR